MTDDAWEKRRTRAILATFQTGRPVFADTDGVLRYNDGDREEVTADVGIAKDADAVASTRASWWQHVRAQFGRHW